MFRLNGINEMTLYITNKCNISCRYCWENHKGNKNVDPYILKEIMLDFINSPADLTQHKKICYLYGGETTMNLEGLKAISSILINRKDIKIYILTNGVDLSDDLISVYRDFHLNCDLVITTTLDFTRDVHNQNRCNTYDTIINNIRRLRECIPDIQITRISVITEQTLQDAIQLINYDMRIDGLFDDIMVHLVSPSGDDTYTNQEKCCYSLDGLNLFFDTYFKNRTSQTLKVIYDELTQKVGQPSSTIIDCGAGRQYITINADQIVSPCIKMNNIHDYNKSIPWNKYVATHIDFGIYKLIGHDRGPEIGLHFESQYLGDVCDSCPIQHECVVCIGMNELFTGKKTIIPSWYCKNSLNIYDIWSDYYLKYCHETYDKVSNILINDVCSNAESINQLLDIVGGDQCENQR